MSLPQKTPHQAASLTPKRHQARCPNRRRKVRPTQRLRRQSYSQFNQSPRTSRSEGDGAGRGREEGDDSPPTSAKNGKETVLPKKKANLL